MRKDLKIGIFIGAAVVLAAAVVISIHPCAAGDKSIQPHIALTGPVARPVQLRQVTAQTTAAPAVPKPEDEKPAKDKKPAA